MCAIFLFRFCPMVHYLLSGGWRLPTCFLSVGPGSAYLSQTLIHVIKSKQFFHLQMVMLRAALVRGVAPLLLAAVLVVLVVLGLGELRDMQERDARREEGRRGQGWPTLAFPIQN